MTNAAPLHLTLHPTTESQFAAGRYLLGQAMGLRLTALGLVVLPFALALACGLLMAYAVNVTLDDGGLVALYASIGAIFGNMAALYLFGRHYRSLLAASALQKAPASVTLSADGVTLGSGALLAWSAVTAVTRWKGLTLLQFSPVDALVIPDANLPPGMTPEALSARIAQWRQA